MKMHDHENCAIKHSNGLENNLSQCTSIPWKVCEAPGHPLSDGVEDSNGKWVGAVLKQDAAFIVRACNYNQALINIAKNLEYGRHGKPDPMCETCQTIAKAEDK